MNRAKGSPPGAPKKRVQKKKTERAADPVESGPAPLQPWERENVCAWLAFTDSVIETARHCGLSPSVVQRVASEDPDYILQVRSAIGLVIRQRFGKAIIAIQDKITDSVRVVPGIPTPEQADAIYTLCKCVVMQSEQHQVISGLPESITRNEGNAIDPRAQREADRRYLMSLMQDLSGKNPQLAAEIIERAQRDLPTAEGENGMEDGDRG